MKKYTWSFQQAFGDNKSSEEAQDADIISSVEFDKTGNLLAVGDKGGRVVLLERKEDNKKGKIQYKVLTEFQSHDPEFDYLKSLEIEEKINQIRWLKSFNNSHFMLTTNDKTIKLWKIFNKHKKTISPTLTEKKKTEDGKEITQITLPTIKKGEKFLTQKAKKVYASAHAYHINSISLNSDGETFLSADDLRVNVWNLLHTQKTFTIVDIKPKNMEDLTEVITASAFHPFDCNTFLYSTSKGVLKMGDTRQEAKCTNFAKTFIVTEDPSSRTFFSEIIASISDAKFSRDGNFIVARDYMTLKIWDIRSEKKPVQTILVHEPLRSKLCDLYENDCIFDKFECSISHDGSYLASGSYKNYFHIFDKDGKTNYSIQATRPRKKKSSEDFETSDFSKKCLHLTMHPQEDIISTAAVNNLYLYKKEKVDEDEKERKDEEEKKDN